MTARPRRFCPEPASPDAIRVCRYLPPDECRRRHLARSPLPPLVISTGGCFPPCHFDWRPEAGREKSGCDRGICSVHRKRPVGPSQRQARRETPAEIATNRPLPASFLRFVPARRDSGRNDTLCPPEFVYESNCKHESPAEPVERRNRRYWPECVALPSLTPRYPPHGSGRESRRRVSILLSQ